MTSPASPLLAPLLVPLLRGVTAALALAWGALQAQPLPKVDAGRVERLEKFASQHVDARHVDVWLPPGYTRDKRYAVLYMHDGQMLYDAGITWNRQAWFVDRVAARAQAEGRLREFIVVGVWNNGTQRTSEYYPQKFLPHLWPEALREGFVQRALAGKARSDAYLRFLVEELKPEIDRRYATLADAEHTFLMGSSMGGLISVYALLEYPQVFGGAAALSTHWIGGYEHDPAFVDAALAYLRDKLPGALAGRRLYMDRGTTELDAKYDKAQPQIDALFRERGLAEPRFVTRVFEGTGHNERAWSERLEIPLAFLLGRR